MGQPRASSSCCVDSPKPSSAAQSTTRTPIVPGTIARTVKVVATPTSTEPEPFGPPNSNQMRTRGVSMWWACDEDEDEVEEEEAADATAAKARMRALLEREQTK